MCHKYFRLDRLPKEEIKRHNNSLPSHTKGVIIRVSRIVPYLGVVREPRVRYFIPLHNGHLRHCRRHIAPRAVTISELQLRSVASRHLLLRTPHHRQCACTVPEREEWAATVGGLQVLHACTRANDGTMAGRGGGYSAGPRAPGRPVRDVCATDERRGCGDYSCVKPAERFCRECRRIRRSQRAADRSSEAVRGYCSACKEA